MTLRLSSISVIALIAVSGSALAQSDGEQSYCDTGYMNADANSDGVIDKEELQKVTEAEFSSLDANGDGTVTQAEYTDCRNSWTQQASNIAEMSEQEIAAMDANGDGNIDQKEYMQAAHDTAEQAYAARWSETGTEKEVRDADMAPATPENEGGVGADPSDMGDSSSASTQAAASGDAASQSGADSQSNEPKLMLRRIIFIPQESQRTPDMMSRDEIAHRTALRFMLLDANRDKVIDQQEQNGGTADASGMADQAKQQFDRADADKSGDLSREEYTADMQARWEEAQSRGQDAGTSGSDVGAPVVYYRYPHPF